MIARSMTVHSFDSVGRARGGSASTAGSTPGGIFGNEVVPFVSPSALD
jgi:hypothetical protein